MMGCAILDSDIVARKNGKRLPCEVLEDENARLRQELAIREASEQERVIEYLRQENVDWEDKYRALAKENERLRKLVRDMVLNMGGCALHGNPLRLREFMARARDLGIEVPDA